MAYAVEAQGLGKAYRLYSRPVDRVLEALSLGSLVRHRTHWALRGVDLAVRPGASLGICGGNGAGKSTLLRLLTGVTHPSEGRYRVQGRVTSLLELGLGFLPDLTGRANLASKSVLLGLGRRGSEALLDEIIEFSELGSFIDQPLRTYSAGMAMRLGFSVAAVLDPDVMILDEVFAVGDVAFQKKCVDRIHDFKRRNKTILFCSHNIVAMRQLCDEAIWLREGSVQRAGDVVSVTGEYLTWMTRSREAAPRVRDGGPSPAQEERTHSGPLPHVIEARVCDPTSGGAVTRITTHDSVEVRVRWQNPLHPGATVSLAVGLMRQDDVLCFGVGTHADGHELRGAQGCTVLSLPGLPLLSGEYLVVVWLLDEAGVQRYHDYVAPESLVVEARTREIGVLSPPHAWLDGEAPSTAP